MADPPSHQFVVFSELDEQGIVVPSTVQCNNCYAIHRVKEVGVSDTLSKETSRSLSDIEDIKLSLPDKLSDLLTRYGCELPTWQEAKYVVEKELWGSPIILTRERIKNTVTGKYVLVVGKTLLRVDTYTREDQELV